jgi:4-aminobutyrate aminotransferase-like enzyme
VSKPKRLEGRNGQVWADYCAGYTQEHLADRYGISQQRVSQIIAAVRATIPPTDLDEARQRTLDGVAELQRAAVELARAPLAPAYSNGRMMVDEDGKPIMDVSARLSALKVATGIVERTSRLLGLDAPTKVEHGMSDAAAQAAAQAAADALSRLHGE